VAATHNISQHPVSDLDNLPGDDPLTFLDTCSIYTGSGYLVKVAAQAGQAAIDITAYSHGMRLERRVHEAPGHHARALLRNAAVGRILVKPHIGDSFWRAAGGSLAADSRVTRMVSLSATRGSLVVSTPLYVTDRIDGVLAAPSSAEDDTAAIATSVRVLPGEAVFEAFADQLPDAIQLDQPDAALLTQTFPERAQELGAAVGHRWQ
jgi:hypothetical protein